MLAEAATTEGEPAPGLSERGARNVLSKLQVPGATRVRVYLPNGELVADTEVLSDQIKRYPLPPLRQTPIAKNLPATPLGSTVLPWSPNFTLKEEIQRAAKGEIVSGQRVGDRHARVVSVSMPVQRVEAVVGVLTLDSGDVSDIIAAERLAILPFITAAGAVLLLSALTMAMVIARPLRLLARAADRLRLGASNQLEAPAHVLARKDEIGDLAQALQRMTGALLERIDANARFAADVSHEIKNPLTSIRSAVETAQIVANPDARENLLKIIAADVGRVDRLITDIARASRIEAETARGAPVRVDLKKLLGDLAISYEATKRSEDEPKVRFRAEPSVHGCVTGQDEALGQVFRNLVDNAKSFAPAGSDVTVTVADGGGGGRRDGRHVRVLVEDRGPGIPPENLETIFRRFYTDRPKGSAFGGNSGLGLSIARQIVEAHKGRIWAENIEAPGGGIGGARFVVELPAAPGGNG